MNLPRVLRDLHAEKRWLEAMIATLEIASRSPAYRFAEALEASLKQGRHGCVLHLSRNKKEELLKMAEGVQRLAEKPIGADRIGPGDLTGLYGAKIIPFSPEVHRKKTAA